MTLLLEIIIRRGISSVMGDRYVKPDENKKILHIDSNNLFCHSRYQPLPYDENNFVKDVKLEVILNTPDDSDIGYSIDVELENPENLKEKMKFFHFVLKKRIFLITLHVYD